MQLNNLKLKSYLPSGVKTKLNHAVNGTLKKDRRHWKHCRPEFYPKYPDNYELLVELVGDEFDTYDNEIRIVVKSNNLIVDVMCFTVTSKIYNKFKSVYKK